MRVRAEDLLGPTGPLAGALGGYEHRAGQIAMARAVERAIDGDSILLCEAGTGTGKTLAYLLPAILSGRRVVVSTANKALQEQIVLRDLPLLRELLGLECDAALVKGLGNYLCLRRFAELRAAPARDGDTLALVEDWARRTTTGDRAELATLPESHPIWGKITSSSDTRIGAPCRYFEACHVTRLRRRALESRVVVVNHHLLLAHLAMSGDNAGGVLPEFDVLIVDEAHRLEDVASVFFGATVSSRGIERLLADVERSLRHAQLDSGGSTSGHVGIARARAAELFEAAVAALEASKNTSERGTRERSASDGPLEGDRRALLPEIAASPLLVERYHALDEALAMLAAVLAGHERITESMGHAAGRVGKLRDGLAEVLYPQRDHVAWLERTDGVVTLSATPVDVGPLMSRKLFDSGRAIVLTSATLTSLGSFEFVRQRLGLKEGLSAPLEELKLEPELSHAENALLYTPTDLPEVTDAAYFDAARTRTQALVELTPGGAFVLATSLRMMRGLHAALRASLARCVLVQGEAPKSVLLERFRRLGDAVLVATMSFWEGVDVPGDALALVVIDRIPFEPPNDPLTTARAHRVEARGLSSFRDYYLPRAAITLAQGYGRLLRTRDDRGVVAVLDKRIVTRPYGQRLVASLPSARRTESLDEVRAFFARWRAS